MGSLPFFPACAGGAPRWPGSVGKNPCVVSNWFAVPMDGDPDLRTIALSAFLEDRIADGFKIETRTDTHAIIVAPRRFVNGFGLAGAGRERRQVVSVAADGVVTTGAAERIRW